MNKDIRLATSFKGHRKRKKLIRLLGLGADIYLIDLWITVAMDCPDGILIGWDNEDIADACGWPGDPNEFVSALVDSRWIDKQEDGNYSLHDWCEHQGWACGATARSESAKKAADARWKKKREAIERRLNKESNATVLLPHQDSNAPSPSPSPSPSLKEVTKEIKDFTEHFIEFISKENPNIKKASLEKSAETIDKLIRLDNYPLEYIRKVLGWAVKDDFWSGQVFSLVPLRQKSKNTLSKFQNIAAGFEKENGNNHFGSSELNVETQEDIENELKKALS